MWWMQSDRLPAYLYPRDYSHHRDYPRSGRCPVSDELTEAGKRIAGTYAMHRLADPIGNLGQFFAVKLQDGTGGTTLYPSMDAARYDIGRRDDENRYMYVQIVPANMSEKDAATLLKTHRMMYDKGIRVSSMDGKVMIPRNSRETHAAQLRSIFRPSQRSM